MHVVSVKDISPAAPTHEALLSEQQCGEGHREAVWKLSASLLGPSAVLWINLFYGRASVSNTTQDYGDDGGSVVSALTFKEIIPAGYKLSGKC